MRILLTGANGQVGTEIKRQGNGLALTSLDKHALDITDRAAVMDTFAVHKPTMVINAAAYTAVDKAETEPELAFNINQEGSLNLALACQKFKIPLIHLSTDYIFDGTKTSPYHEDDRACPIGVYAQSKWEGEQVIRKTIDQHLILRVSWVFGRQGQNFVKTILRLAQEREILTVVADQFGAPTYANNIAETVLALTTQLKQNPAFGTYHYTNAPTTTWHAFATAIVQTAQPYYSLKTTTIQPIKTEDFPTKAKRPSNSCLDCAKIASVFNIQQQSWQLGLQALIKALANDVST